MEAKWTMIYSSADAFHVEMLKGLLAENHIECVIVNKKDSAYLFGEVELHVNVEDAFIANQIIRNTST